MIYYTSEIQIEDGLKKTAGIKARDDIEAIFRKDGYKALQIESAAFGTGTFEKLKNHYRISRKWKNATVSLKKKDILIIQFPAINHSLFLRGVISDLQRRGVRIVLLIHDLEILRDAKRKTSSFQKKLRNQLEEMSLLKMSDAIIAHNSHMIRKLSELGIDPEKMVSLEIFDYLIPEYSEEVVRNNLSYLGPVIIAGNLRRHKAEYAYHLPSSPEYNLYGVDYELGSHDNIAYHGALQPDELPLRIRGSFGLVWDGEVTDTCGGVYGEYLKINNPHKTSLYLSAGIPILVWKKAAVADYVTKNKCGIAIDSLDEISHVFSELSEKEYWEIVDNAMKLSGKLRSGYYVDHAVQKCEALFS